MFFKFQQKNRLCYSSIAKYRLFSNLKYKFLYYEKCDKEVRILATLFWYSQKLLIWGVMLCGKLSYVEPGCCCFLCLKLVFCLLLGINYALHVFFLQILLGLGAFLGCNVFSSEIIVCFLEFVFRCFLLILLNMKQKQEKRSWRSHIMLLWQKRN